jgi:hypothetical protein
VTPSNDPLRGADGALTERAARRLFDRAAARFEVAEFHRAHEDWEPLWHDARGERRLRLQGLVQVAAAFHFFAAGSAVSFEGLLRSGAALVAGPEDGLGLDTAALSRDLGPWVAHAARVSAGADLRADSPTSFPRIPRLPGVVPDPLPDDVEVDPGPARRATPRPGRR